MTKCLVQSRLSEQFLRSSLLEQSFVLTLLACLLLVGRLNADEAKPTYWDQAIDFTGDRPVSPNLTGTLNGEVAFIQNTLVGPKRGGQERPRLVTDLSLPTQ